LGSDGAGGVLRSVGRDERAEEVERYCHYVVVSASGLESVGASVV